MRRERKKIPVIRFVCVCLFLTVMSALFLRQSWHSNTQLPTDQPTQGGTTKPREAYSIRFDLFGNNDVLASTDPIALDQAAYSKLMESLDCTTWTDLDEKKEPSIVLGFDVSANGQLATYGFTNDGYMVKDGKIGQMKDATLYHLIMYLEGQDDAPQTYLSWLADDARMQLKLESGSFEISIRHRAPPIQNAFGRYGRIGDYVILTNGFESQKKKPIFYIFHCNDVSLAFQSGLSHMEDEWILPQGMLLALDSELVIELQMNFFSEKPYAINLPPFRLTAEEYMELQSQLDSQLWWSEPNEAAKKGKSGSFTLRASFLNGAVTEILSDEYYHFNRYADFAHEGRYAYVTTEMWEYLMGIVGKYTGASQLLHAAYSVVDSTGKTIILNLDEKGIYKTIGHMYEINVQTPVIAVTYGNYMIIHDLLFLYNEMGLPEEWIIFRITEDGLELPVAVGDFYYVTSPLRPFKQGIPMKLSGKDQTDGTHWETDYRNVGVELAWTLFGMLERLAWRNPEVQWKDNPSIELMHLHFTFSGESHTYTLCDQNFLQYEGKTVRLNDDQMDIFMKVVSFLSE